jgi:hypothetical protein
MRCSKTHTDLSLHRFNALLAKLRRPEVIAAGKACVQRIHRLASRHAPSDAPSVHVNARVFLAAAIISYFQNDVFPVIGPLEARLTACATTLLDSFDKIVVSAHALRDWRLVPDDIVRVFGTTILAYIQLFAEWKTPDAARFIEGLRQNLLELYDAVAVEGARGAVDADAEADTPEVILFAHHTRIERLRHMMLQVSGPQVLALFDAEHPRPPIPPTPLLFQRTARWNVPTHEMLAHELFLDDRFAPTLADIHPPQKLYKGFWKTLELATTATPPCFARAMYVLRNVIDAANEIKGGTFSDTDILALSNRFVGLEIEHVVIRSDGNTSAAFDMLGTVLDTLAPLMPSPLAQVLRAQWEPPAQRNANTYAAALRQIHDTVPHMFLDVCIERLRGLPRASAAAAFERARFQDRLDRGEIGLQHAARWIEQAVRAQLQAVASSCSQALGTTAFHHRVLSEAMLGLITAENTGTWESPSSVQQIPETLLLDLPRIALMRKEYARILDILVVIAVADHALTMAALPEPDRVLVLDNLAASVIMGENRASACAETALSGTGRAILLYQIADSARPNHTVRLSVAHCLPAIWASFLSRSPSEAVHPRVVPLIEKAIAELEVLCAANHLLHAHTYERLIREAVLAQ